MKIKFGDALKSKNWIAH